MRRGWLIPLAGALFACWWLLRWNSEVTAISPVADATAVRGGEVELTAIDSSADSVPQRRTPVPTGQVLPESRIAGEDLTTRLTVRVLLPGGAPWSGGGLRLLGEEGIWVPNKRADSQAPAGATFQILGRFVDHGTHVQALDLDAEGAVHLAGLPPGQPFELRAVDPLGGVGGTQACEPFAPGEAREVLIRIDQAPFQVEGRCVDESGLPLADVQVTLWDSNWGTQATTNVSGWFATAPLFARSLRLSAEHDGSIAEIVTDVRTQAQPLELVIRKGRRLTVELLDELGEPVADSVLTVHAEADGPPLFVRSSFVDGVRVYEHLPARPLTLRWGGPCSPQTLAIDVGTEGVRLRAERHGKLAVQMSELPGGIDARYQVELLSGGCDVSASEPKNVLNTGRQQMLWTLPPGRYRLQIRHWPEAATERSVLCGAAFDVEVFPGETTIQRLGG